MARYRQELMAGSSSAGAATTALKLAGPTVLAGAGTIVFTAGALTLWPIRLLQSIGLGAITGALCAAFMALTLLPLALAATGGGTLPHFGRRDPLSPAPRSFWTVVPSYAVRYPWPTLAGVTLVLLAMAAPLLSIRLGVGELNTALGASEATSVSSQIRQSFSSAVTDERMTVFLRMPTSRSESVHRVATDLASLPGATVAEPLAFVEGDVWKLDLRAAEPPLDVRNQRLVEDIYDHGARYDVTVASPSANVVDRQESLRNRLPVVAIYAAGCTFAILFLLTGSVVIPLKIFILNLASFCATAGFIVAGFQYGWLRPILGADSQVPLELILIATLFVILFGFATDYGVFVISRIQEYRDKGLSNRSAITSGLAATGPVVSTAALLLCTVLIGFLIPSDIPIVQQLLLGLVVGVIADAVLIRALLVPSLMTLLGSYNWWAPRSLQRLRTWILGT